MQPPVPCPQGHRNWRLSATIAASLLALLVGSSPADASPHLLKGIFDDVAISFADDAASFDQPRLLGVQIVRVSLHWGGPLGVSGERPQDPTDPDDPSYDWARYDRAVLAADRNGIQVLFSIISTPAWANGDRPPNVAPESGSDLRDFTTAAATRYGGRFRRSDGTLLPAVRHWLAWNEPNNPVFLSPQYIGKTIVSGLAYARICNAVVQGVRASASDGQLVACGGTAPRGNNNPSTARPSVSPLAFLNAMKKAGARGFDAYAHHPYYRDRTDTPLSRPLARTAITLGNIDVLLGRVTELYGSLPLWITEYGFQTNPPDDVFGVTYAKQATYVRQAYEFAKSNSRIDIFIWFLLSDETELSGWQSGLVTATGEQKPSWRVFQSL